MVSIESTVFYFNLRGDCGVNDGDGNCDGDDDGDDGDDNVDGDDNDDGMAPESNWFWPKWKQQGLPPICSTIEEYYSIHHTQSTIVQYCIHIVV